MNIGNMDILLVAYIIAFLLFLLFMLWLWLRSPFKYPYKKIYFDVSSKRNPKIEDQIDNFLNEEGFDLIEEHCEHIEQWKKKCREKVDGSLFRKKRERQFQDCIDDENAFQFIETRTQTRYRQRNYVKSAYKVDVVVEQFNTGESYLRNRYKKLKAIDFACTISEYHAKDQRRLMTKELRDRIARRDNYTCQICGKYMPDGVGLHIDHIVPIAKGGKSVPSNLQVLCSKCNGRKSSK